MKIIHDPNKMKISQKTNTIVFLFAFFLSPALNLGAQKYKEVSYGNNLIVRNSNSITSLPGLDSLLNRKEYFQCDSIFYPPENRFVNGFQVKKSLWVHSIKKKSLDFSFYKFEKPFYISKCECVGDSGNPSLNFSRTVFSDSVFVHQCSFLKNDENSLPGLDGVMFRHTTFNRFFSFKDNVVYTNIYFINSNFKDGADFRLCEFKGNIDFRNTKFQRIVSFGESKFYGVNNFLNVTLPDTLIVSRITQIEKPIDLTVCNFKNGKKCKIDLLASDISKFRIDFQHFELCFLDSVNDAEKERVYTSLLNNFSRDGDRDSYRVLDIEFQKFKFKKDNRYFQNWLQEWWWNYGYSKEKIFRNTFYILLLFAAINFFLSIIFGPSLLMRDGYQIDVIWNKVDPLMKYQRKNWKYFYELFQYIFIYTAMLFLLVRFNVDSIRMDRKLITLYLSVIFSSGLICIGYIVNFILSK